MNLLISLRSELLKTTRTASFYLTLFGAAVGPVIYLFNVLIDENEIDASEKDPLNALFKMDSAAGVAEAKRLAKTPAKGRLVETMTTILVKSGDENSFDIVAKSFDNMPISQAKFNLLQPFCEFLSVVKDTKKVKTGVDMVIEFRDALAAYGLVPYVNNLLQGVIAKKNNASAAASDKTALKEQVDYINSKIGTEDKKGF